MNRLYTIRRNVFLVIALLCLNACFSQTLSTLASVQYNSKTNTTAYNVLPLGLVYLPGEWKKEKYNPVSGQQWFMNKDTVLISIALTPCNKFEFSKKSLKDFAFVKTYYEWDSKYLAEKHHLSRSVLVSDSIHQYIIWRLSGDHYDDYFLFGNKDCKVHNYSLPSHGWTEEQKIKFLQDLYLKQP